jgi:hypothetical protein
MKNKIYVVYGRTGDYEDKREWTVCAYLKESDAIKHVELAQMEAAKFRSWCATKTIDQIDRKLRSKKCVNKYDPRFGMDDGYTYYCYGETTLYKVLPSKA